MDTWAKQRIEYYEQRIPILVKDLETVDDRNVVMVLFSIKLLKDEIRRLTGGSEQIPDHLLMKKEVVLIEEDDCTSCKI